MADFPLRYSAISPQPPPPPWAQKENTFSSLHKNFDSNFVIPLSMLWVGKGNTGTRRNRVVVVNWSWSKYKLDFLHPLDTNNLQNIELEFHHQQLLLSLKSLNLNCVPRENEQHDYYGRNLNLKLLRLFLKTFIQLFSANNSQLFNKIYLHLCCNLNNTQKLTAEKHAVINLSASHKVCNTIIIFDTSWVS